MPIYRCSGCLDLDLRARRRIEDVYFELDVYADEEDEAWGKAMKFLNPHFGKRMIEVEEVFPAPTDEEIEKWEKNVLKRRLKALKGKKEQIIL